MIVGPKYHSDYSVWALDILQASTDYRRCPTKGPIVSCQTQFKKCHFFIWAKDRRVCSVYDLGLVENLLCRGLGHWLCFQVFSIFVACFGRARIPPRIRLPQTFRFQYNLGPQFCWGAACSVSTVALLARGVIGCRLRLK